MNMLFVMKLDYYKRKNVPSPKKNSTNFANMGVEMEEIFFVTTSLFMTLVCILFYKHLCKRRPSPDISRLDGRCLRSESSTNEAR